MPALSRFTFEGVSKMKKFILPLAVCCSLGLSGTTDAQAQMDNQPYAFPGGSGISIGGKQAIMNQEINNLTPKNLVRGADGHLLDVTKGAGGIAITRTEDGAFVPSFRGSNSFRDDAGAMSVGVFNAYFVPKSYSSNRYYTAQPLSSTAVSTWTARVISDGTLISYAPDSTVDIWTGMVYIPR